MIDGPPGSKLRKTVMETFRDLPLTITFCYSPCSTPPENEPEIIFKTTTLVYSEGTEEWEKSIVE